MFFLRLIGALIIVVGLYLVLWGKSGDHTSSSKGEEDSIIPSSVEATKEESPANAIIVSSSTGSAEMNSFVAIDLRDNNEVAGDRYEDRNKRGITKEMKLIPQISTRVLL